MILLLKFLNSGLVFCHGETELFLQGKVLNITLNIESPEDCPDNDILLYYFVEALNFNQMKSSVFHSQVELKVSLQNILKDSILI